MPEPERKALEFTVSSGTPVRVSFESTDGTKYEARVAINVFDIIELVGAKVQTPIGQVPQIEVRANFAVDVKPAT